MKVFILITALCCPVGAAYGADSQTLGSAITVLPALADITGYERIHVLHTKKGRAVVGLYGKPVVPGVFSELLLINEQANSKLVIYLLDSSRFLGINGIEHEPDSARFYGYKVVVKGSNYIVVNYLSNSGKNVSDDVTISWNDTMQRFEFEKT